MERMEGLENKHHANYRHHPTDQYLQRRMMFQMYSRPTYQGRKRDHGKTEQRQRQTSNRHATNHAD